MPSSVYVDVITISIFPPPNRETYCQAAFATEIMVVPLTKSPRGACKKLLCRKNERRCSKWDLVLAASLAGLMVMCRLIMLKSLSFNKEGHLSL